MSKKFCVIGDKSNNAHLNRTWFETESDATDHAKKLLRQKIQEGQLGSKNAPALMVVEVKKVVGTENTPIKVFEPNEYEF